jgi:hypothetical protein
VTVPGVGRTTRPTGRDELRTEKRFYADDDAIMSVLTEFVETVEPELLKPQQDISSEANDPRPTIDLQRIELWHAHGCHAGRSVLCQGPHIAGSRCGRAPGS